MDLIVGYADNNTELQKDRIRDTVTAGKSMDTISRWMTNTVANLKYLKSIVRWNKEKGIKIFKCNSSVFNGSNTYDYDLAKVYFELLNENGVILDLLGQIHDELDGTLIVQHHDNIKLSSSNILESISVTGLQRVLSKLAKEEHLVQAFPLGTKNIDKGYSQETLESNVVKCSEFPGESRFIQTSAWAGDKLSCMSSYALDRVIHDQHHVDDTNKCNVNWIIANNDKLDGYNKENLRVVFSTREFEKMALKYTTK